MAKYHCLECDREFDEPDEWEEDRGEFWGVPCSERMSGCPYCRGEYMTVEEYEKEYGESEDEDEYEFDPRDADCESQ